MISPGILFFFFYVENYLFYLFLLWISGAKQRTSFSTLNEVTGSEGPRCGKMLQKTPKNQHSKVSQNSILDMISINSSFSLNIAPTLPYLI